MFFCAFSGIVASEKLNETHHKEKTMQPQATTDTTKQRPLSIEARERLAACYKLLLAAARKASATQAQSSQPPNLINTEAVHCQ
jgi:hypothetical protein